MTSLTKEQPNKVYRVTVEFVRRETYLVEATDEEEARDNFRMEDEEAVEIGEEECNGICEVDEDADAVAPPVVEEEEEKVEEEEEDVVDVSSISDAVLIAEMKTRFIVPQFYTKKHLEMWDVEEEDFDDLNDYVDSTGLHQEIGDSMAEVAQNFLDEKDE